MFHFWFVVWQKAFADSLSFIQQSWSSIAFAVLFVVLTIAWLIRKHGWRGALKQWFRTSAEGLGITAVAFLIIVIIHFAYAPLHLLEDEEARKRSVERAFSGIQNQLAFCQSSLKSEEVRSTLLQSQVTAQQGLINTQQATTNSQQSTFNLCVATLAKANAPAPQKTTMLSTEYDSETRLVLILTNKPVTPVRMLLWCDGDVTSMSMNVFGSGMHSGGVSRMKDRNAWLVGLAMPVWAPESPMMIKVVHRGTLGGCSARSL